MRPTHHAIFSAAVGAVAWAVTDEPLALPLAVGSGVLIDADHLLDQVWYFQLHRRPAALLVLHAWEWVAVLVAACIWLSFPWWLVAVSIGYAGHLATDQAFNHVYGMGYFITYRAYHAFDVGRFTSDWRLESPSESLTKELKVIKRPWRWLVGEDEPGQPPQE